MHCNVFKNLHTHPIFLVLAERARICCLRWRFSKFRWPPLHSVFWYLSDSNGWTISHNLEARSTGKIWIMIPTRPTKAWLQTAGWVKWQTGTLKMGCSRTVYLTLQHCSQDGKGHWGAVPDGHWQDDFWRLTFSIIWHFFNTGQMQRILGEEKVDR